MFLNRRGLCVCARMELLNRTVYCYACCGWLAPSYSLIHTRIIPLVDADSELAIAPYSGSLRCALLSTPLNITIVISPTRCAEFRNTPNNSCEFVFLFSFFLSSSTFSIFFCFFLFAVPTFMTPLCTLMKPENVDGQLEATLNFYKQSLHVSVYTVCKRTFFADPCGIGRRNITALVLSSFLSFYEILFVIRLQTCNL